MELCPNCLASLKTGVFNQNALVAPRLQDLVNEFRDDKKEGFCQKCYQSASNEAFEKLQQEEGVIRSNTLELITSMPAVSSHSSRDWEYETIGLVTGQSVMGTGIFSEISSGWSDLFGKNSAALGDNLRAGERACLIQIKKQAFEVGGNAILALDIDYNELGGGKGLIMVCMTGTAVLLKNDGYKESGNQFFEFTRRLAYLNELKATFS